MLQSEALVQPESREAQPPAAQMASDWDQVFAVDIVKRLDSLEARVACQLDQLTSAHHKRITAIKVPPSRLPIGVVKLRGWSHHAFYLVGCAAVM